VSSLADRLDAKFANVKRRAAQVHEYQRTAVDFMWLTKFSALFIDTGLGKTLICLMLIDRLLMEDWTQKILVVAPVRVAAQTWPTEIQEWEHTAWMDWSVIRAEDDDPEVISAGEAARAAFIAVPGYEGRKRRRDAAAAMATTDAEREAVAQIPTAATAYSKAATAKKEELRLQRAKSPANVHIINRETLVWLIDLYSTWKVRRRNGRVTRTRRIVGWPYRTVIIDESSSFKDHTAARFKALAAVRSQGFLDRLHELTATPAAESYLGLFPQIFLLDLGERLGNNITAYKAEFFQENVHSRKIKILPGAEEKISERIADICLVMKSPDYLDEQEPLFLDRPISLTELQAAQYKKFQQNFILHLEDGEEIEAETAASLSSKLLQLASGAVYNAEGQTRIVHSHKLEDLQQLQEELGDEPILVAYWYKSSLARLRKAFPKAVVMDKSGKCLKDWNAGKIKMLLVHPAGVGHGLNMQYGPGHDVYFYDACWSYELFYQLYRRLHRQGQKKRVRVHLPQVIGTNDVLVFGRLREKQDAQETLFDTIKALWRAMKRRRATEKAA
jgi:hypothetical protein